MDNAESIKTQRLRSEVEQSHLTRADWVARKMGLPVSRIYDLARQDLLPHVRLGRQVRFVPEQIEAFIASGGASLPGGWRRDPGEARRP